MSGRMAGQTINDRFLAAKHSLAGQGLAKAVCKATTEELIGPKKKHLDYLVHCTNEPNVSIPQLANLLIERSQNTNWVVVYKALITVHHMMCYGNERFTQYLASSNSTFQLSNFFDKSGVQGFHSARTGYDMSPFIRRYARYLNEKALSYRTVAFDFCKVKRGKEDGTLRTMNPDKLLKTLPTLQSQLDALLEFDCSANDLTNGVINMCFMLLFRDLIRLFALYNDGIINLLEKFFDMNKKQCREAIDIYKKFLIRMDRVAEFLKVAENVGIDKGDIPDLTKTPSSLLDALEQHLSSMDGKKSSTTSSTPASQTASNQKNVRSGVTALSSTSSSFGNVVTNGRLDSNSIDEHLKQQVLAEEEAAMNQFKSKVSSPVNTINNPFLNNGSTQMGNAQPAIDLFSAEPIPTIPNNNIKASDDLLQLNPFSEFIENNVPPITTAYNNKPQANAWVPNGNGFGVQNTQPVIGNTTFVSESNFQSVFGNTDNKTAEGTATSFNPFLVDDPIPNLLLDLDSPSNSGNQPIHSVLSYFQKQDFVETSLNDSSNVTEEKTQEKVSVDQKLNIESGKKKIEQVNSHDEAASINTVVNGLDAEHTDTHINSVEREDNVESNHVDSNDKTFLINEEQEQASNNVSNLVISSDDTGINMTINNSRFTKNEDRENDAKINRSVKKNPPPRPPPPVASAKNTINPMEFFEKESTPLSVNLFDVAQESAQNSQCDEKVTKSCDLSNNYPFQSSDNNPLLYTASGDFVVTQTVDYDPLGGVLQPTSMQEGNKQNSNNNSNNQQSGSALLTGDLESSLASLAENLSISSRPPPVKEIQWNSPKNGSKVGNSWTPQPISATTGAGYKPMNQSMPITPQTTMQTPMFPMQTMQQPMMGMRPMVGNPAIIPQRPGMPAQTQPMNQSLLFH